MLLKRGIKNKNFSAVIPAAGYSSRMGLFKPLLPLSGSLVIEKVVSSFLDAGIDEVIVVLGYRAEMLIPLINKMKVRYVINDDYNQGMYSSVQAGLKAVSENIKAFFLLPADYPLISSETIMGMQSKYKAESCDILSPVYKGKKGHPPLISSALIPLILRGNGEGGLKQLLKQNSISGDTLVVDDPWVIRDLDTEEDYREMLLPYYPAYPTREECELILEKYNTPVRVREHMKIVSIVAVALCEHLNSLGFKLHTGLVMAASLLHDVVRNENNHAIKAGQIVVSYGYPAVAKIIESHMDLPEGTGIDINEKTILYYADKTVEGDKVTSLQDRLVKQTIRFKEEPEAIAGVVQRMKKALELEKQLDAMLKGELGKIIANL